MRSITRISRPALAAILGAALALAPSAALAAGGAAPAAPVPTVAPTLGVTASGGTTPADAWSLSPRAQVTITSPKEGETVSPGNITFSGTAAPRASVAVTIAGPGAPGSPGWEAGERVALADTSGRWSFTDSFTDRGSYVLSIRTSDPSSDPSIRFTVGTATAPQQGSVHILSPREGKVVSPGTVIISGRAAPHEAVVSHVTHPDGDSEQGPAAEADAFGNWTMSLDLGAPGTYDVGVRNYSVTGWDSVSFTVGASTTALPTPCEHGGCDNG